MRGWIALLLGSLAPAAASAQVAAPVWPHARSEWASDIPCTDAPAGVRLRRLPPPDSIVRPGCISAHCQALPGGRRVCACTRDSTSEFALEGPGVQRLAWAGPERTVYWDDGGFRVMVGDLDHDGREEVILSYILVVSNGMGVSVSQIAIFDGARPSSFPLQYLTEEFGQRGAFTWSPTDRKCRVLATRWQNATDRRRGPGLYLVGEWFEYRSGELIPDTARPVLARRFLNSFEAERGRDITSDLIPFKWLRNPRGEPLLRLPPEQDSVVETVNGTIARVTNGDLFVEVGGAALRRYSPDYWPWDNSTTDDTSYVALILGGAERVYPQDYRPVSAPSLVGRRVIIVGMKRFPDEPVSRHVRLLP